MLYADCGFPVLPLLLPAPPHLPSHPDPPLPLIKKTSKLLRDNNKIYDSKIKQNEHVRTGQNKETEGKETKRRHKEQKPTCWQTQESPTYTKLES